MPYSKLTLLSVVVLTSAPFSSATLPVKHHFAPDDPKGKLTSVLRQTLDRLDEMARTRGVPSARLAGDVQNPLVRVSPDGELQVYLKVTDTSPSVQSDLAARGARIVRVADDLKLIEAWVLPDRIQDAAVHPAVVSVRPVGRPVTHAGSVTTQGDAILGADRARALGYDGTGVKVGVISDDVDHLAAAQATDDVPANVTVLQRTSANGDEGTAMLEIVHDIAPGAELYFYSGINSSLDMRNGIRALANAGCKVIVDDIGWFDQPFFQDGYLAQAVDEVATQGVVFCSAAGNAGGYGDGWTHYEYPYTPANGVGGRHAWDGVTDSTLAIWVASHDTLTVLMQWDDPFGESSNDYDLYLYADERLTAALGSSVDKQSGTQDPEENLWWYNASSSSRTVYLAVNRYSGAARRLELFIEGGWQEWYVPSGSVFGHPAARGALAVGAINASDQGHDNIASYSSQGPARIAYPLQEWRLKPDVTGIDGVSVTGAGGFNNPFYGTSAAAPHVAAVAALVRQGHPNWSSTDVRNALTSTAADRGTIGPDYIYGAGVVGAPEAVGLGPTVVTVRDIPNDQGGRVIVTWTASSLDNNTSALSKYSVWCALPAEAAKLADGRRYRVAKVGGIEYVWGWLADCPAIAQPSYWYVAATLYDSMSTTSGLHNFMVIAHTSDPAVFFTSNAKSGYSVDNLAPLAPKAIEIIGSWEAGKITVSWPPNTEADLKQYLIYRSAIPGIDPAGLTPYAITKDTLFVDGNPLPGTTYYVVRAQDIHENFSAKSNEVAASRPLVSFLAQNAPNPFNPSTRVRFTLVSEGPVRLAVYNTLGQEVRLLVDEALPAGVHHVVWDGRDASGNPVGSGVYVALLRTGDRTLATRMTLTR